MVLGSGTKSYCGSGTAGLSGRAAGGPFVSARSRLESQTTEKEVSKSKGLFSLFAQVPKPLRRLNAIDERGNHPALLLKHM